MGQFELSLREFAEKAGENARQQVTAIVLEVWSRLIVRSPVDTGRFRANWIYTPAHKLGRLAVRPPVILDQNAGPLMGAVLPPPPPPQIDILTVLDFPHRISNHLPYAMRLERGHSKQAPGGMVALTLLEFESIASTKASV